MSADRQPAAAAARIRQAAVLGAGTMGHGIAQVLAQAGIETRLHDVAAGAAERAISRVRENLDKGLAKGKLSAEQRAAALDRLSSPSRLDSALEGVQLVVEAAPESLDLKRRLFAELGSRLGPDVILATNTSSLPVSEIARAAAHPERVVGLHFFNPVHIMKLVEVVRGEVTSRAVVDACLALVRRMGKEPIDVRDAPGFASSRLGLAIGLEAMRMVEEQVASAADIDRAMVLGYGFPMGPLALTDLVGLDVRLSIAEHLERELGPRFAPPAILRDKVERGELGKKSGRGFHDWNEGSDR